MSAEGPTSPPTEPPPRRPKVIKSNQQQVLLYVVLTLLLSLATVWGGRAWLHNSETLTFAVGDPNSDEALFAAKLAAVLKNNASRFRLKIVNNADNAKAVAQFDRKQADLAVLRTDAKVPLRARALAILEHDLVLLLGPGNKKIKSLAELKKKKIAVLADSDNIARLRPQHPRHSRRPGRGEGADGAAGLDARQAVRAGRLWRGGRHRRTPRRRCGTRL